LISVKTKIKRENIMNRIHTAILPFLCLPLLAASAQEPDFLAPPQHVGPPLEQHAVTNRAFQGISSLAVAPGGRLWVTWYAGKTPGEDHNNYVVLSTSGDNGKSWKEVRVVDPDGDGALRTYDPEVWVDPSGRLWLIWAQALSHDKNAHTWAVVAEDADAEQPQWSAPRLLAPGVMMCKPTVLRDGTWVFPISDWEGRRLKTPAAATAGFWISTDQGATFTLRGAALVPVVHRTFDEHMFIERRDGSLWNLIRTNYGIGESVSIDGGKTWSEAAPSSIRHPPARFFISRLASGNLLLVKHGPIDKKSGRSHLMAFVSTDDGKTWGGGLMLDERSGVSYPDGQQSADGTITITYDYNRTSNRHILFATFREEDVAAGKAVSTAVRLRQLVSEGSGGLMKKPAGPAQPVNANADGAPLLRSVPGRWSCAGCETQALTEGVTLFADRAYTLAELPAAFKGAQFLRVAMDGTKKLKCEAAGVLHILTPAPERNQDSAVEALLQQGFSRAAVPEVRLFNPENSANYCTLYQKKCAAGEIVTAGKWGLPVILAE